MTKLNPQFNPVDTLELKDPGSLSKEEAELEIAKINGEQIKLSNSIKPYRKWIQRTFRRIEALNKYRHELQLHILKEITKVPLGKKGESIPRHVSPEELKKFIDQLEPEQLQTLALIYGIGGKE